MHRPLTAAQRRQHAAFLRHLARTGNATAAARAIGVSERTLHARRRVHPAFATRWDAALAIADARLHRPSTPKCARQEPEATISIGKTGRLQVRRARPDAVTPAAGQRFLLALAATANVSLSAAAAGASPAAFNKRRRANPAFAREVRAALADGFRRLELALLESWMPGSGEGEEWRDNSLPALPQMTPHQAVQLIAMHRKEVKWRDVMMSGRRLPGETSDMRSARLSRLYRAKLAAQTENEIAAKVIGDHSRRPGPDEPIILPDLAQVKGWSQADPAKTAANAARMLGEAMREKRAKGARGRGGARVQAKRRGG